ncbi:signal peptide peptidase SppA [Acidobacteriota bacterium]
MRKRTYVLIIFLIFFVLILATILSFIYFEFGKPPSVRARSYLEIPLSGEIQEKAPDNFLVTLISGKPALSMYDIWVNIQKAKIDNRIQSLVIRLGYLNCDWGKINELREIILDFKTSGKKVYAYIEETFEFDKEYYLATACDSIILHPLGTLVINGIGGYIPFFKNSLDKLGIEAEIEHVEEFKTAFNMFTEEGFTPAHKLMIESLYENLFSKYLETISQTRGKTEKEARALIDHGFFQGDRAREAGLVDDLLFEDEFENLIRERGEKTYKISHAQYNKIKPSSLGLNRGKKIALIYGMGTILTGESSANTMGSKTVARWIKRAREDKSITAIVFRVDSPGGSAVASDIIWREIILAKKEKPVVISMSGVAGSGGYWVSMAAHKIVAHPQTLTGSIGVVFGKFNFKDLSDKLGITTEKLIYGNRADMFSTFKKLTPEERAFLKKEILWSYDQFLTRVAEGRKMTKEAVDNIAKGRVWSGSQAQELGLVDELGGLSKAIELAKELAGIPYDEGVKFVVWPKKVSLLSTITGKKQARESFVFEPKLEKVLFVLKALSKERIWALMPFWIAPQ